jgi:hypothetical protein
LPEHAGMSSEPNCYQKADKVNTRVRNDRNSRANRQ